MDVRPGNTPPPILLQLLFTVVGIVSQFVDWATAPEEIEAGGVELGMWPDRRDPRMEAVDAETVEMDTLTAASELSKQKRSKKKMRHVTLVHPSTAPPAPPMPSQPSVVSSLKDAPAATSDLMLKLGKRRNDIRGPNSSSESEEEEDEDEEVMRILQHQPKTDAAADGASSWTSVEQTFYDVTTELPAEREIWTERYGAAAPPVRN